MVISKAGRNLGHIISSALIFFYLSDAINKYFQVRSAAINDGETFKDSFSVSIFFRLAYELIFLCLIFRFYDKQRKRGIELIAAIFCCFLIGNLVFLLSYSSPEYSLTYHVTLLNKYIFVFVTFYAIKDIVDNPVMLNKIYSIFKKIYWVNSTLIILGLIFNINLLKSYYNQEFRYGYNGLIPSVNEATLFYMIGISLFYFNYIRRKEDLFTLSLTIVSSLFIGAKAMYLFLFLLLGYHILFKANYWQKVVSGAVVFSFFLVVIPILSDRKYSYLYEFLLFQYEKEGFLFTVTSGRSSFVITKFLDNLNLWGPINYFFGGTDQLKFYIEMDFFDSFLLIGLIGTILLFKLYFNSIFRRINYKNFRFFFMCSFFLVSFMVGHFFASAVNALYLNIAMLFMYKYEDHSLSY